MSQALASNHESVKDAEKLGVTVSTLHDFVTKKEADAHAQLLSFKTFLTSEEARDGALLAELNNDKDSLDKAKTDAAASVTASLDVLKRMNSALSAERDVRQKMLDAMTWRDLSKSQQNAIEASISSFKGMRADIFIFGDNPEIINIANKIGQTLRLSGWDPQIWSTINGGGAVWGIPVFAQKDASNGATAAARSLTLALVDQKISAKLYDGFPNPKAFSIVLGRGNVTWEQNKAADVRIFVGAKR